MNSARRNSVSGDRQAIDPRTPRTARLSVGDWFAPDDVDLFKDECLPLLAYVFKQTPFPFESRFFGFFSLDLDVARERFPIRWKYVHQQLNHQPFDTRSEPDSCQHYYDHLWRNFAQQEEEKIEKNIVEHYKKDYAPLAKISRNLVTIQHQAIGCERILLRKRSKKSQKPLKDHVSQQNPFSVSKFKETIGLDARHERDLYCIWRDSDEEKSTDIPRLVEEGSNYSQFAQSFLQEFEAKNDEDSMESLFTTLSGVL